MTAAGVNALVFSPLDDRTLVRPAIEVKSLGIPTVIFNSAFQGNHHVAYMTMDNYKSYRVKALDVLKNFKALVWSDVKIMTTKGQFGGRPC